MRRYNIEFVLNARTKIKTLSELLKYELFKKNYISLKFLLLYTQINTLKHHRKSYLNFQRSGSPPINVSRSMIKAFSHVALLLVSWDLLRWMFGSGPYHLPCRAKATWVRDHVLACGSNTIDRVIFGLWKFENLEPLFPPITFATSSVL